jgi:hypothetical protein
MVSRPTLREASPLVCDAIGLGLCYLAFLVVFKSVSPAALKTVLIAASGLAVAGCLFKLIFRSNSAALLLIFGFAFSQNLFHLFDFPRAIPTLTTDACVLLFCCKAAVLKWCDGFRHMALFGKNSIIGLIAVAAASFFLNDESLAAALLWCRQTFMFILFFFALQNLDLSEETVRRLNRFIVFLFLIQLPAGLLKYLLIGQDEVWIGTVSKLNGSLSAILPMFAVSFLFAMFLNERGIKYLVLIVCFFLFGIIGEKRAIGFFILLILVFETAVFLWARFKSRHTVLSSRDIIIGAACILMGIGFVLLAGNIIASYDPKGRAHGPFDLKFIFWERVIHYNFRNMEIENNPEAEGHRTFTLKNRDGVEQIFKHGSTMGRGRITLEAIRYIISRHPVHWLFGFGPGSMNRSPRLDRSKQTPYEEFGIFGSYTGFIVYVLQIGFLGVFCLFFFFVKIVAAVYHRYRLTSDCDYRIKALGFLGINFSFFIDFFFYSQTTINQQMLMPVYFYASTLLLKDRSTETQSG